MGTLLYRGSNQPRMGRRWAWCVNGAGRPRFRGILRNFEEFGLDGSCPLRELAGIVQFDREGVYRPGKSGVHDTVNGRIAVSVPRPARVGARGIPAVAPIAVNRPIRGEPERLEFSQG